MQISREAQKLQVGLTHKKDIVIQKKLAGEQIYIQIKFKNK